MEPVRWGILGVARINRRLIPAFLQAEGVELRAIASRELGRAQEAARQAGIPVAHGSYDALLADRQIDCVYIPLPNDLHGLWTRRAADAGKHILCEKPLARDATEAESMVRHCQARGVRLMDGFMWPHHPRTELLRRCLDRGTIGRVLRVNASFTFHLPPEEPNIRWQAEQGGGSLMDVGCYPVYFARWVFRAEPVQVAAMARWHRGVDAGMTAVLDFGGGRQASIDCGFDLPLRKHVEIVGDGGCLRVEDMWVPPADAGFTSIDAGGLSTNWHVPPSRQRDQIARMLERFSAAVRDDRPTDPPAEEGVATLRVLDALRQSAREARVVTLAR